MPTPPQDGPSLEQPGPPWAPQLLTNPSSMPDLLGSWDCSGDKANWNFSQGGVGPPGPVGGQTTDKYGIFIGHQISAKKKKPGPRQKILGQYPPRLGWLGQDPPRTKEQNCLRGPCYRVGQKRQV